MAALHKHHEEDAKHNKQGTTNLHGARQGQQIMGISLVPTHQDEEALNDTRYHGIHCGVRKTVKANTANANADVPKIQYSRVPMALVGAHSQGPENVLHAVAVADHQHNRKNADRHP